MHGYRIGVTQMLWLWQCCCCAGDVLLCHVHGCRASSTLSFTSTPLPCDGGCSPRQRWPLLHLHGLGLFIARAVVGVRQAGVGGVPRRGGRLELLRPGGQGFPAQQSCARHTVRLPADADDGTRHEDSDGSAVPCEMTSVLKVSCVAF